MYTVNLIIIIIIIDIMNKIIDDREIIDIYITLKSLLAMIIEIIASNNYRY